MNTSTMPRNRTAIITCAGSGIGEAIALLFARNGARVMLADLHAHEVERVASAIQAERGEAVPLCVDVSRPPDRERLASRTVHDPGRIDTAVNAWWILVK